MGPRRCGERVYASWVSSQAEAPVDAASLLERARSLIEEAAAEGVTMRLLGGLGVYALAESARSAPLARAYRDFDLAVGAKRGPAASRVLETAGLVPDRHFNALHGARRMVFVAGEGYGVDLLIGRFEMCHALELEDGFDADPTTIAPADLLLTKLQIVAIEPKDLADASALVLDLPPGSGVRSIHVDRFVAPLAEDWGFFHTVELNMPKLVAFGRSTLDRQAATKLEDRLGVLSGAMSAASKSLRWRVRARVGERVVWYEIPEEVD
jgi:hypothetical protein